MRPPGGAVCVLVVGLVGLLAATAGLPRAPAASAQGLRLDTPAPAIAGGPWIGSEPLSMERLRGRVVLVEFWTYG